MRPKNMKEFDHKNDWYYEGNVSKKLVEYLKNENYTILKDNSENIKSKGIDIIVMWNKTTAEFKPQMQLFVCILI